MSQLSTVRQMCLVQVFHPHIRFLDVDHKCSNIFLFPLLNLCPVSHTVTLLIIPKENLNRQPRIPTHLKPLRHTAQRLDLLIRQFPTIQLKVLLHPLLIHTLWNNTPTLLDTPSKQYLLRRLALLFSKREQSLVLVKRRVGGSETRVAGSVDALGGVVGDELGGWVVGVDLDLVYGWDDLAGWVVEQDLEVLDAEVGDADGADFVLWELLHLFPGLDEVPVCDLLELHTQL